MLTAVDSAVTELAGVDDVEQDYTKHSLTLYQQSFDI